MILVIIFKDFSRADRTTPVTFMISMVEKKLADKLYTKIWLVHVKEVEQQKPTTAQCSHFSFKINLEKYIKDCEKNTYSTTYDTSSSNDSTST